MKKRLNKFLASKGVASRRAADKLILNGKVKVNGVNAQVGTEVNEHDNITVSGKSLPVAVKTVYIAFNKPPGVITTASKKSDNTVLDYINVKQRIFPIGRLDVASEGLLLLTNDGDLANALTHPKYRHEKKYEVVINKKINDTELDQLQRGVELADGITLPAKVQRLGSNSFSIILRQGKNRQIRRMCEALGYYVVKLKRNRIASVELKNLKQGTWRELTKSEIKKLKANLTQQQNH